MKRQLYCVILLFLTYSKLYAQNQTNTNKIVVVYSNEGTVFTGLCANTESDPLQLIDFNLGVVVLQSKQIRSKEFFDVNSFVKVSLSDNRVINGSIEKINNDSLLIKHVHFGNINIPFHAIAAVKASHPELPGKWNSDPNCTRYFFAPSAFMLRKGEGYYQNAYILSNSVNYGINDHVTIGGGIILPIFFYITPKIGYSVNDYVHFSAGVLAGGTYLNKGVGAGIGYGLITLGTRDYHFTAGAGYGTILQNEV
jgi:hypothetical protein